MKAKIILLIAIILFGGFYLASKEPTIEQTTPENTILRAPDFTLLDYNDTPRTFSEISKGKIAVVNAWATWCPFCTKELEDFAQLQERFGDDIVVIAVDRQESREKAQTFTDSISVSNRMTFLLDPTDSFYRSIGGFSMPETIFVNTRGEIVLHKRGPLELDEMTDIINSIQ